jgi:hypothetical protein
MSKAARVTLAISLAAIFTGLSLSAMAQQPAGGQPPAKKPPVQGQPKGPAAGQHAGPVPGGAAGQMRPGPGGPGGSGGAPGQHGGPGPGQAAQFHGAGAGPGGHPVHAIGERGYSFHAGGPGRRDIATFNERERAIWGGGLWHHERRFGRMGYWWEVNGAWYYYDQPMAGPPAYVSEMEFFEDGLDPGAPVMVGQPAPVVVVAPPPVVYVRPPPPPPVVCIGPLCVR